MSGRFVRPRRPAGHLSPLGPGGRAFARWRPLAALLAAAALFASAIVLLSDRAPGLLHRFSARIDPGSSRAAQLASQARPTSDFEIHVFLWAVVAILVGLAMWSSRSLLVSAIAVLVGSVAAEAAQDMLTQFRDIQVADLTANVIGVFAGLGVVSALSILLSWKDEPLSRMPPGDASAGAA